MSAAGNAVGSAERSRFGKDSFPRTTSDQCYRQVRSGFKVVIIETRVPGIATDPSPHPLAPGGEKPSVAPIPSFGSVASDA
ncbi:hypothetical protein DTO166G5_1966 [Paecilomyces variotii]|nr:hypothetical protein DTO166G5_1966 [Paecilomyces variotii]